MSLINQMLQDLDARRAAPDGVHPLPSDVRTLPPPRKSALPIILGALVLLVLAGTYGLYQWTLMREAVPSAPLPQSAAVAPNVVPPAASDPAPVAVALVEAPSADSAKEVEPEVQSPNARLRMAEALAMPLKEAAEPKSVGMAENPAFPDRRVVSEKKPGRSQVGSAELARPLPQAVSVPPPKANPGTATSRIEKTDAIGTPQERAEAEYRKSINALNQGREAEAIDSLQRVLRHNSLHAAARQLLIRLLLEAKRQDEAIQVLAEGLQEQPAHLGWAMSLARLQMDRGEVAGAWKTLEHSMPAASGSADYQGFSGHVLHRLGRHREAVARYQSATRLSPKDGRWWLGMGLALDADGRSGEARDAFQHARQSGTLSNELSALVDQKLRQ